MECNKDEASRAKKLAENLMRDGDFLRAQKLIMKAQRLFSGLDSLPQMLAVCDVHCSAEKKINGLENWYGILQVMHFSDVATIKKQYKKLALLLHPDKNQFAGAEAAFKLIGEANRLLSDKEKRTQYDIKHRKSRVSGRQLNANSGLQRGAANSFRDSIDKKTTFFTCCEHCGYSYKYLGQYVNTRMYCSSCQRSFMAYDTGMNGAPPKSNISVNRNVGSTGAKPGNVAAEVDKKGTSKEISNKTAGGGENRNAEVRKPNVEDESLKNCAESSKPQEGEGKMNNIAEPPKTDGLKQQHEVVEPKNGASKSVPDDTVSRSSQARSMSKDKKKRRKIVEEPTEDKVDSTDNNRRTSPRKSQQVSWAEKGRNDNAISPPTKRSRSKPNLKDESMKNCAESSKSEDGEGKMNNTAEPPKTDALKPQHEVAEPEKGASKSVPDDTVSRSSQARSMSKDKRKRRKIVEEPTEDKVDSTDNNRRTSPRKSQQVSCAEKGRNDNAISPPTKRSRSKPTLEDEPMKNCAESSKPEEGEGKMNNIAEPPKTDALKPQHEIVEPPPNTDALKPQHEVAEPEKGALKSAPDDTVSRSSQARSMGKDKKKKRKIVEEPTEDKVDSKENNRRTSSRKSQQVSCAEKGRNDDAISPPTKRSRSNDGLKSEGTRKKQRLGVESSKRLDSGGSSSPSCDYNGKAKKNVDSGYQEISSTEDKKNEGYEARGEGMGMEGKIDSNHNKPITQDSPDPDFNNFDLTTSCFAVNQVWSLYDPTDGMPRFYARIKKVIDSEFKLWITWLDPLQDNSIPIACGVFQDGESQEVDDHLIFSCQMLHIPRDNYIVIYPRTGEVWAVYRGWDISWSGSSENHKGTYEYDFVEVLCDFKDANGLGVAYLGKVEGFVSLFRREATYGVLQLQIPPNEMLRFSHKVPSFKLTGREREGVPPGCFELDTAALPKDLFEDVHSKVDCGLDRQRPNDKTGGPISEASKVEVQANTTLESSLAPKKRQKVNDNHSSFSKASEGVCSKLEMNAVKKSRKSVKAVDDLKLRKSPRLRSETNNQATSRLGQEKAEKKSANGGTSCGQPDGFCLSDDETMTTPKKSAKVTAADSSRIRKTRGDIHKPTGNSKKCGRNVSLSKSEGNDSLTRLTCSINPVDLENHGPSSCATVQENTSNFENQRSVDIFQIDQIWAIYCNDDGMPRKYAQIKRIDEGPEFKLHVAPLELCRPPNLMTHPVCCGCFKLKTGKADVLVPSSFSHQVKAVKSSINRYEVYPGKGEIWALYKNWNTTYCAETEELEIVEVVETNEQSTQVVLLTAIVSNKLLYGRSQELKDGFVDIPREEVSRFSHQIPAFRHDRRATRFGDKECWELDPKAVVDLNSKKP